ncbi:MAG: HlyD family efflux transporter periplasmic adaptor subunit [Rubrivivax sp.]
MGQRRPAGGGAARPTATRARFYVAEAEVGSIAAGQRVLIECGGCGAPIAGRIEAIATQPEYTPPVIYSNAQRSRLVFMVEARAGPRRRPALEAGAAGGRATSARAVSRTHEPRMSPPGRPKRSWRSAKHEGPPVSRA